MEERFQEQKLRLEKSENERLVESEAKIRALLLLEKEREENLRRRIDEADRKKRQEEKQREDERRRQEVLRVEQERRDLQRQHEEEMRRQDAARADRQRRAYEAWRYAHDPVDFFVFDERANEYVLALESDKPADSVQVYDQDLYISKPNKDKNKDQELFTYRFFIKLLPQKISEFVGFPLKPDNICDDF